MLSLKTEFFTTKSKDIVFDTYFHHAEKSEAQKLSATSIDSSYDAESLLLGEAAGLRAWVSS